ncbi:DUF5605 domain-containing protein [Streptodolium elevatio]
MAGAWPDYFLAYFGRATPAEWRFAIPFLITGAGVPPPITDGMTFRVEILDTWNMTVTPLDTLYTAAVDAEKAIAYAEGDATVKLPADPYPALRIQRVV